ncbi:MAG: hypothetical protein A2017_18790 [Lentisphaerae bacterium GWF2_44_16]|nr:MAG: hypothetical protein A2017_18790 [Lentisphaerae bacterium GWF2_44_16]
MKKLFRSALIFSVSFLLLSLFSSCRSGEISEEDKLNPIEQKFLEDNARQIFLKSKKFKLTPIEMGYIRNNEPEKGFAYTGYKEGKATFSWQVSDQKRIILIIEGDLLKEDRTLRVIVSRNEDVIYQNGNTKDTPKALNNNKGLKDTKGGPPLGNPPSL